MNNNLLRQILVIIAVVATIIVNGLANALPINGMGTGDISDQFNVLFVPAGYVFSIWGVIYLGLIAYAVYQALPSQRDNARLRSIDVPFYISSLANITWIFLWHYLRFGWTIVAMLVILLSLITIYRRLNTGISAPPFGDHWLVQFPFAIYLGWITVATIANMTVLLDVIGWGQFGLSDTFWFVTVTVVALAIAGLVMWRRGDLAYLAVLTWAFAGIAVKHSGLPTVTTVAWVAAAITVIMIAVAMWRRKQGRPALIPY